MGEVNRVATLISIQVTVKGICAGTGPLPFEFYLLVQSVPYCVYRIQEDLEKVKQFYPKP